MWSIPLLWTDASTAHPGMAMYEEGKGEKEKH